MMATISWNAIVALAALTISSIGFAPAYYVRSWQRGGWYTDAIRRKSPLEVIWAQKRWQRRWMRPITTHACLALLWTILGIFQTISSSGVPHGPLKTWHRRNGYVTFAMGLGFVVSAAGLQLLKEKPFGTWLPPIWLNAVMSLWNMVSGVFSAYGGDIVAHETAMVWACIWTSAPGFVRVSNYVYTHLLGGSMESGGPVVTLSAASLQLVLTLPRLVLMKEALTVEVINYAVVFLVLLFAALGTGAKQV